MTHDEILTEIREVCDQASRERNPPPDINVLVGKTILRIEPPINQDEGIRIIFQDGSCLQVGYSILEGTTQFGESEHSPTHEFIIEGVFNP